MKKVKIILSFTLWIAFLAFSFAQSECEVWCPVSESFINVCSDCGTVVAAENCADAGIPSLYELDGFVTTTCAFTPDGPGGLPGFCGPGTIVHNNMWIGFTPQLSGRLHLNIEIIECLSPNPLCLGVQAAVARALCANPGNVFFGFEYETLACVNCVDQTFDLITNDAIAGVPHYIMIDGCCGDVCEIKINVIEGISNTPSCGPWELQGLSGTICEDILDDDCASPQSTATVFASPGPYSSPDASLIFKWYDPEGTLIYNGPGLPVGDQVQSTLFGINPNTGNSYLCKEGIYEVTIEQDGATWLDSKTIEMNFSPAHEAQITVVSDPTICESIELYGDAVDPNVDILFQNWFKVDYSTDPPTASGFPSQYTANTNSFTVFRDEPSMGPGTYLYTYIDRNSICISQELIEVQFEGCDVDAGPNQTLNCITSQVTLNGSSDCSNSNYNWSGPNNFQSTEQSVEVSIPGLYRLSVYDVDRDCNIVDWVEVFIDQDIPFLTFEYLNGTGPFLNCSRPIAELLVSSVPEAIVEFQDETGLIITDNPITISYESEFTITVTNPINGCVSTSQFNTIADFAEPSLQIEAINGTSSELTCNNPYVEMLATTDVGNSVNYEDPLGNIFSDNPIIISEPGEYTVVVQSVNGCTASNSFIVTSNIDDECSKIFGITFWDENLDCLYDSNETTLANWQIEIFDGVNTMTRTSDNEGFFDFYIAPGQYTFTLIETSDVWMMCPSVTLTIEQNNDYNIVLGAQNNEPCTKPYSNLTVPSLSPCKQATIQISYGNLGNAFMDDASLELRLDKYNSIESSELAYEDLGNNLYRFELGIVEALFTDDFNITILTDCDAPLNWTHCFQLDIYPKEDCENINPAWDGSSLSVEGIQIDNKIIFTIINTGEDMTSTVNSYIIEDDVLMRIEPIFLNASNGNQHIIEQACTGNTYRVEVQQSPNHPGFSYPSISVEGCDGEFVPGFVNRFSQDDQDLHKDISCIQNVGTETNNYLTGYPLGVTIDKCVDIDRQIEYVINFQNTESNSTKNMKISNRISENLDLSTLRILASSHPYDYNITGEGILEINFSDIDLPSVGESEAESKGFLKYSILPRSTISLGTDIENQAHIYFGTATPTITNTTLHKVDENCIEMENPNSSEELSELEISISPNPFNREFTINFDSDQFEDLMISIYDISGKLIDQKLFNSTNKTYTNDALSDGVYVYKLTTGGVQFSGGKLIKTQ